MGLVATAIRSGCLPWLARSTASGTAVEQDRALIFGIRSRVGALDDQARHPGVGTAVDRVALFRVRGDVDSCFSMPSSPQTADRFFVCEFFVFFKEVFLLRSRPQKVCEKLDFAELDRGGHGDTAESSDTPPP